jgi:hypothetical protein
MSLMVTPPATTAFTISYSQTALIFGTGTTNTIHINLIDEYRCVVMREFLHFPKMTIYLSGSAPSTEALEPCTRASSTNCPSSLVRDIQTNLHRREFACLTLLPHLTPVTQCKFTTRVFHPNVDAQSGSICLDILTADKWSAVLDVSLCPLPTKFHSIASSTSAGQGATRVPAISAFRAQ